MALETIVFQQDPFSYGCNQEFCDLWGLGIHENQGKINSEIFEQGLISGAWESSINSSSDTSTVEGSIAGSNLAPVVMPGRKRRRRTKSFKNKEEMENQRMTHIAVERNRRRQMNDYLAVVRSMMPPSYAQRGDQASIVGGAINFVKELEQLLQFLQSHKQVRQQSSTIHSKLFDNFFTFPQYSTCPSRQNMDNSMAADDAMAEKHSTIADVEVTMAENHANIKLLTRRRPKQLLTLITGFHSLSLAILHLNITTRDHLVLYSFSVKVEDDCQLTSVNEIATAVHDLVGMIHEEAASS
ncbi:transcription factor bHLH96-like [Coffea eugenioides]|uniref:transcription factor bHLH96-like n=1 Tax=Coffea eugenioides TaxID=49369 RepID=UPI000F614BF7|nr:transcription factor bHLH96-like [Coffea eugenioides]